MKHSLRLTLVLAACLLIPGITFAASSVIYGTNGTQDDRGIEVTAEVTAHTDGSVEDTYLSDSLARQLTFAKGYRLVVVRVFFGSPAPLDNSDFTLEENFNGVDILGGAGLNTIDNATNNAFTPLIGSTAFEAPVYGPLKLRVSGNNVNGAKFRIVFSFVPM